MKNRLFAISTALLMVLSLAACSPVVEKEQPQAPGGTAAEQDPVSSEKESVEQDPVSTAKEGIEVSEEYVDEAIELATYSINTLYTKNENFTNEQRREAINDIAHPLFLKEIEKFQIQIDAISEGEVLNLQIGKVFLLEGVTSESTPELEKQSAFKVDYKVEYKHSGETDTDEGNAMFFVDNGVLKFASFYNND